MSTCLKAEVSDDILERYAFNADESDILQNPLVQSTLKFLRNQMKTFQKTVSSLLPIPAEPVAISLSGGRK